MKKKLACILVMVLLASAVPLAVMPAGAMSEKKIPCDGGDNKLTRDELVNAILPYMLDEGTHTLDDVGDAAWVYAYWDGKPKTTVDDCDRTVTTYRPLERIVAGYRHSLETLRSLKVPKETIVGVEETWLDLAFFPEFADKPTVGIVWTPDVEAILNLDPDAVILIGSSRMAGALDTATEVLESAGVTVIRISLTDIETYQERVEKLGYIFDKEEEAEELFEFIEKCSNSVSEKTETIPEEDIPRVYFESAFYTGYYYIAGSTYLSHIEMAGGKDIFAGLSGYMSAEAIIDRDPEIILKFAPREYRDRIGYSVDVGDTEAMKEIRDEIISREELQNVTAVKNERVYVISGYLGCGGPVSGTRSFLLPAYLAKMFHPGHFDDLNPKALHQEYLTRFQGLDIDLDEKGVFVYPEEPI